MTTHARAEPAPARPALRRDAFAVAGAQGRSLASALGNRGTQRLVARAVGPCTEDGGRIKAPVFLLADGAQGRSLASALGNRGTQRLLARAVGPCTEDGGRIKAPVFLLADGTAEPKLQAVYDDRDRLQLGTFDSTPLGPVRRVQQALKCAGYGALLGPKQDDGKYGPLTNKALKQFKVDHDLQPAFFDDVGPKTMHCLNELAASCSEPPKPEPPKPEPPKPEPPKPEPPKPEPPKPEPPKPPNCGPGTDNPFCLPIPPTPKLGECCKPFPTDQGAEATWNQLSATVPKSMAATSVCGEVEAVWDAYFARSSKPFAFDLAKGSCIAKSAKDDTGVRGSGAAAHHAEAIDGVFALIMAFLPETLTKATLIPFPFEGPLARLRIPLTEAVGPKGEPGLHVDITYGNAPQNAAGILLGGTGRDGGGSDIFGDDDRVLSGRVAIDVTAVDAETGALSGEIRWVPHVHVKDTVDFCPGNQGGPVTQQLTLPLSKLEAHGLVRDVPITVDYDVDVRSRRFERVVPRHVEPPVPPPRKKRPRAPGENPCR